MAELVEFPTINRGIIHITPKQPFFDWINELDPESPLQADTFLERTGYAYRDDSYFMNQESLDNLMKKYHKEIFENELAGMWIDTRDWPKDRSWEVFGEWFEWRIASLVYDLETSILEKEDDE